jgi:hypothetical protein
VRERYTNPYEPPTHLLVSTHLYSPTVLKQPSEKNVDDAFKREHRKE